MQYYYSKLKYGTCTVNEKYSTHTVNINTVYDCITVNEITVLIL